MGFPFGSIARGTIWVVFDVFFSAILDFHFRMPYLGAKVSRFYPNDTLVLSDTSKDLGNSFLCLGCTHRIRRQIAHGDFDFTMPEQFLDSFNWEPLRVHGGKRSAAAMQRVGKAAAKVVTFASTACRRRPRC
jgi:hypothetical protein